jgi:hypothetical protein
MKLAGAVILALTLMNCGGQKAGVEQAEKKLSASEKELEQAKGQPGAEQKVAELERQLAAAKKELAEAKGETPAAPGATPAPAGPGVTPAPTTPGTAPTPTAPGATPTASAPGATPTPAAPVEPPPPPPPPPPKKYVIPAGTAIPVRTTTMLSTKTATTGAPFEASLTQALTVDGVVLARAGAPVSGVVVLSDPGGRVKGKASISLALKSIKGTHGPIPIQTNSREQVAASAMKKDLVRGGIMSGAGAAIGAIAGGGKGAAIGAGIGAGAGVGTAMATKGAPAEFPAETALTFTTKASVTVTVQP